MEKPEKLDILVNIFGKLNESQKDHIGKLIRELAEIHCNRGFSGEHNVKDRTRRGKIRINPA